MESAERTYTVRVLPHVIRDLLPGLHSSTSFESFLRQSDLTHTDTQKHTD